MPLSDVRHQDAPQRYIQRAMRTGRLPHGLIFAGPDGVGKQLFAERLAGVLLCQSPIDHDGVQDACGKCVNCDMSGAGTHPDFHLVHRLLNKFHPSATVRARKATQLSIAVIRHFVIGPIGMRPSHAAAKVFVIAEAELMNAEAQNAMLKTLEEPPNNSHIILIARSADGLLETIRSRCQLVQFASLPTAFVRERLHAAQPKLDDAESHFIAELAGGSIGRAIWLASIGLHEQIETTAGTIVEAMRDPVAAGAGTANAAKALSDRIKTDDDTDAASDTNLARLGQSTQIALITSLLRESLRIAVGVEPAPFMPSQLARIAAQSSPRALSDAIRSLNTADFYVSRSANTNLIFDSIGIAIRRAFERKSAA